MAFGSSDLYVHRFCVELEAVLDGFIKGNQGQALRAPGSGEGIQRDVDWLWVEEDSYMLLYQFFFFLLLSNILLYENTSLFSHLLVHLSCFQL